MEVNPMSFEAGDKNRNGQILVAKTNERGNHRFARVWILQCTDQRHGHGATYEYRANSCDFHVRQCPLAGPKVAPGI